MARLPYNNEGGFLGSTGLTSTGTTITFAVAPNFATITGSDYIVLLLDPGTSSFEIVYLTAYTSGQTTGTITRQAEDSTRWPETAHNANTGVWTCGPTANDAQYPYGVPAGRCYATSGTAVAPEALLSLQTADFVRGGVTFSSSVGNTGLVVPVTGVYSLCGQVKITNAASNALTAFIAKNGGASFLAYGSQSPVAGAGYQASVVSDIHLLTAGDVVNIGYIVNSNTALQFDANNSDNYLSLALVSAP